MVKVSEIVVSNYTSASSAGKYKGKKFIIDAIYQEVIGGENKVCMRLAGVDKPIVLNRTNLTILSLAFGDDTDLWVNKKVQMNIVKVSFQDRLVDGFQFEPVN